MKNASKKAKSSARISSNKNKKLRTKAYFPERFDRFERFGDERFGRERFDRERFDRFDRRDRFDDRFRFERRERFEPFFFDPFFFF